MRSKIGDGCCCDSGDVDALEVMSISQIIYHSWIESSVILSPLLKFYSI